MKLYGITYGDKITPFTEYKNNAPSHPHRFEYDPMVYIVAALQNMRADEHVGIFSHKFTQKTGFTKQQVEEVIINHGKWPVINFSPNLGNNIGGCGNFMQWSIKGHGERLRELLQACCAHVGIDYTEDPEYVIYANQFTAHYPIYLNYINHVVMPCINLMEGPLWDKVNVNANYVAGLPADQLQKTNGLQFYNYLPFVLERMFMMYVATNGFICYNAWKK